jgi:hypothetical protein
MQGAIGLIAPEGDGSMSRLRPAPGAKLEEEESKLPSHLMDDIEGAAGE